MIGENEPTRAATLGVYPPRTEAGFRAETYRAWLPPRLTPWAGKSERRQGGSKYARRSARCIYSRTQSVPKLSRRAAATFSSPGRKPGGCPPSHLRLTEPRLRAGWIRGRFAYPPRLLPPIIAHPPPSLPPSPKPHLHTHHATPHPFARPPPAPSQTFFHIFHFFPCIRPFSRLRG